MKNNLLLLVILFFCANAFGLKDKKLIITGSSTVAPLVEEIGRAFEIKNPGIRVDVQSGGSSRGIADVLGGMADIGMVSRQLKPEDGDLKSATIAKDGVCIILHAENPVRSLSDDQIRKIYQGVIKNWQEVGGKQAPITVVNKAEGRSTLEVFLDYFKLKNSEVKAQIVIGDNEQGIKTIVGNPNSIGYVSIGSAEFNQLQGKPIQLLPVAGVAATIDKVKSGEFPLSRTLNLVTKSTPKGLQLQFIQFAQSSEVAEIVKKQFFVPAK